MFSAIMTHFLIFSKRKHDRPTVKNKRYRTRLSQFKWLRHEKHVGAGFCKKDLIFLSQIGRFHGFIREELFPSAGE